MAIYSAVPPPPEHQDHPTSSQVADIEAWTVSTLQSLSVSTTARGTGVTLSIPLDAAPPADDEAPARPSKPVYKPRREPLKRDSLRRREALLKGKDGSRRRQRWENDRLLHVPNAQPPLPSDWEVRPTHPVHHVPYYLAPLWDAGVRQRVELTAAASKKAAAKRAGVDEQRGRVPHELKQKLKKAKGAQRLLQHLEEDIRLFLQEWNERERQHREDVARFEADSSDDEIVFIGRDGSMSDEQAHRLPRALPKEKLIYSSCEDDPSASFGRWLVHSLALYYGLQSRSTTVGRPARREALFFALSTRFEPRAEMPGMSRRFGESSATTDDGTREPRLHPQLSVSGSPPPRTQRHALIDLRSEETRSLLLLCPMRAVRCPAAPRALSRARRPSLQPRALSSSSRAVCSSCRQLLRSSRPQLVADAASPATSIALLNGGGTARAGSQPALGSSVRRGFASTGSASKGPLEEYDHRVKEGRLRDDAHQRGIIENLQKLHDDLQNYKARPVVKPTLEDLLPKPEPTFFEKLFSSKKEETEDDKIPENLPRGLYLFGDVGSGKTMLMDLFYDTLPSSVQTKTRIHFHNFMQDVHKRLHKIKMQHGNDIDGVPFVAADIADQANVLCFDEFQCTDVADAMILRRLLEGLMSHGVVLVTTSNRHPDELYRNGVQRESFIPCIELLKTKLHVINLDSPTDYRKIPRPPSGVYHHPLDGDARSHVDKWLGFLGDPADPPHPETQTVWGRAIHVPKVSGQAAVFSFDELIVQPKSAADYIELTRSYTTFIVTDVPGMTHRERDWARRFITFIDAVYEAHAKLVLTAAVPIPNLFVSKNEIQEGMKSNPKADDGDDLNDAMRMLMDDLGMNMQTLKSTNIFSGDEEIFAFARALSRLTEMGSTEWVERGLSAEQKEALKASKASA